LSQDRDGCVIEGVRTDGELLRATRDGEPEAFGELFARHRALVLAYLTRRSTAAEAADLLAETFAAALLATHDGRAPGGETAAPWLLTIARNKLLDQRRRGRVEDAARRRLALEPAPPLTDADLERISELGADVDVALALLGELPRELQAALRARVLEERPYDEIAREQRTSEAAVRQRVSRALRRLRTGLEEQR
jgi:RNA polymerase sigma-70 factor (ECF subfamily)